MATHKQIAQAVDVFLEVLGTLDVPGTPLARRAVQAVEGARRSAELRRQLEALLHQTEQEFLQEAHRQRLDKVAQWVAQLPIQDLPSFRRALESLLKHWNEERLEQVLEDELAPIPGLRKADRRRAATLYLRILRRHLVAHEPFNRIIVSLSVLRTEAEVQALYEALTALLGLPVECLRWPVTEPPREGGLRSHLLHPKYRLVPYIGDVFQNELQNLLGWARELEEAKGQVGLRIYIAPGGSGKTRLLIEAGEALRREGWWTGFLSVKALDDRLAECLARDPRPILLILDYVAERAGAVLPLLRAMARVASDRENPRTTPLALVLLERHMPDWLQKQLTRVGDPECLHWPEFLSLSGVEQQPHSLASLEEPADREELFAQAMERFCGYFSAPPGRVTYNPEDLPDRPLLVLLLALHAAAGERVPRPQEEEAVLDFTWRRAKEAWERHLHPYLQTQGMVWALEGAIRWIETLTVLATLGRKFPDAAHLAAFLRAHPQHFPPVQGPRKGEELGEAWLAARIPQLFPQAEGTLVPPIAPDPLADFVLERALDTHPDLLTLALPTPEEAVRAPEEAAEAIWQALMVLARLWPQDLCQQVGKVERVAEHLAAWPCPLPPVEAGRAFWKAMERHLPDPTILFRRLAVVVYQAQMAHLLPGEVAERARLLNNLARSLSALGRREEALTATEEAVGIYRPLAQANPVAFLPDLAMSLHNLGRALSDLGWREEALAATEEAVGIYRPLAQAYPQAFLPDLAMSLNNLGRAFSDLGRREEALTAAEEAVGMYRQLAQAHPEAFLPDLAMSLHNLGRALSDLGRREEALAATEEAVGIYRPLAQAHPEAFLPYLAGSLHNLGLMLSELGRQEEALTATEEAVGIYQQLAQAHPQAFLPDLARSLHNLGAMLSDLGRREEALAATEEAVGIYRQLAQANPVAFLPDLAMSLHNLGRALSALGRREEALAATEEAVGIYRPLAQADPQAFLPDLAGILNNLANRLSALGRREEALTAAQEAAELYRELARAHPEAFRPDLAGSLNNLANRLSALGRREEALAAIEEAVKIRRQLAQANPQAFLPDLAMSLHNLGTMLSAVGRREEALAATEEAVGIYRPLARAHPEAFLPDLARSLHNLGAMLSDLGRREEALAATEEAVGIYQQLAQAYPQAFLPILAASLANLGTMLSAVGRREEALAATEEAVKIRRQLAQAHPQAFLPDLAGSLNNLGLRLSALGRQEEALAAAEEAVEMYRQLAQAHPQAFLPYLAMSLHNLGRALSALGRREGALRAARAFGEGLEVLLPFLRTWPRAFAPLADTLLEGYRSACRATGQEPDARLVAQVIQALGSAGEPAAV